MKNFRQAAGILLLAACCLLAVFIAVSAILGRTQVHTLHRFSAQGATLPALQPRPVSGNSDGLNLNTATREELMTLPGISTALAEAIIAQREIRPFSFVEDLRVIKGIGEKRVEALREAAYVGAVENEKTK